ncbi:hypothetical protein PM082_017663 [Marasmius tenuissimus]|nr:hypothetical protein PM082_017663 [Marasmius tenuissimus]
MGFFSSRRAEDDYVPDDKHTVVNVIRSRFYGKSKGKEREVTERPRTLFLPQDVSAAQALSHPTPTPSNSHSIRHAVSIPILSRKSQSSNTPHDPHTPNSRSLSVRLKSSVRKNFSPSGPSTSSSSNAPPSSQVPSTSRISESQESTTGYTTASIKSASPRKQTDSVTATLAQRLSELAAANEQGLLNDDEYRALRQNLFERFTSNATVPTENPVVPATPQRRHPRGQMSASEGRASTSSRPSSNFFVEVPRSPSIRSKASIRSGVASLFRTGGRRTASGSTDLGDTMSVYSSTSVRSSQYRPQPLRKKSSQSSVHTEPPRASDTISIASRRTERIPPFDFQSRPHTPSRSSIRRIGDAPPSSFPKTPVSEKYSPSVRDVFDDASLKTSRDIKLEMEAVEGERARLLDAFNGLEVTTLAKRQRHPSTAGSRPSTIVAVDNLDHLRSGMKSSPSSYTPSPSSYTPDSPSSSHLRVLGGESDVLSIRSGTSVGMNSLGRSATSKKAPSKASSSLLSSSSSRGSLQRKSSNGSASSGRAAAAKAKYSVPPVPAIPPHLGNYVHGSNSSINLTRSTGHLPMTSLPEDGIGEDPVPMDEDDLEFEAEMDDIRRRREEVYHRYEARLEYLRAKLKGAQLHEKLMKK